eukprot:gene22559-27228_t
MFSYGNQMQQGGGAYGMPGEAMYSSGDGGGQSGRHAYASDGGGQSGRHAYGSDGGGQSGRQAYGAGQGSSSAGANTMSRHQVHHSSQDLEDDDMGMSGSASLVNSQMQAQLQAQQMAQQMLNSGQLSGQYGGAMGMLGMSGQQGAGMMSTLMSTGDASLTAGSMSSQSQMGEQAQLGAQMPMSMMPGMGVAGMMPGMVPMMAMPMGAGIGMAGMAGAAGLEMGTGYATSTMGAELMQGGAAKGGSTGWGSGRDMGMSSSASRMP